MASQDMHAPKPTRVLASQYSRLLTLAEVLFEVRRGSFGSAEVLFGSAEVLYEVLAHACSRLLMGSEELQAHGC